MSSLNAFVVAVDLAVRQRDAARQRFQDMQGARQAAQAQLDQLSGYAADTQQRWGMREGAAVQPEDVRAWCAARVSDYKTPEFVTVRTEPLPRNANGKIMKPLLRQQLA